MKSNPRARGRRAIEPTPKRRTRGGSSPKPAPRKKPAACPRVPICLLDAVRAGRPVRVVAKGQRWAVVEEGVAKPLAQRKHQEAAEQLVQVAYADLERELQLACPPPAPSSNTALVFTPQRPQGEPVRYAVLEAADVVSSHDPMTFGQDPRYPPDVQERVYHRDPNEQRKVQVGAQTLQPAIVLNRAPTPEAGPPLVVVGDAHSEEGSDLEVPSQPPFLRDLEDDIPREVAEAAHQGTSHAPEARGAQERGDYARTLTSDYEALAELVRTPEERATLDEAFGDYRRGYRERVLESLSARSRLMSSMIAGPSNFPKERNERRSSSYQRRVEDAVAYRAQALDAIRRALRPELRPVMAGDDDAVSRLAAKIAKAEADHARMLAINAAIRGHAQAGREEQIAAIVALGETPELAEKVLTPDPSGAVGFAAYALSNSSANLRRMKARLELIRSAKATEATELEGEHARLEDAPADNRVRLFFADKPAAQVRQSLKSKGFRWAPSLGAWQAYRNPDTLAAARAFAGVDRTPNPLAGQPAIVLGGNGRSMMIRRAYAERLPSAKAYRADLEQRAGEFGIDPATVQAMEAPILVRVVEGLSPASDPKELAAAVRRYNETMTAALDAKAAAVAKARQLSDESIEEIGRILSEGGDKTLRKLMADEPAAFLRLLEHDGILTRENRAEYTQAGALTDRAKDELEGMFLGRVLGTADRLAATSDAIANKVERAAPFLLRVEGVNPQFSRIATMQAAVDLANETKARKLPLEDLLAQEGMFDKRRTDTAAEELARILLEDGPRKVADRFRRWADVAARDTTQSGFALFTEPPPTADDANAALFRRLENPCAWEYRRPNPSIVCPRCKGTGKSAPWATQEGRKAFDTCPLCAGRGVLVVDELAHATPTQPRLFNPGRKPAHSELRVVIESAGKDQHGVALYRPCLARVEGTKVREVFQCGDTTKTAIETAFDAAKRLGRQLNVAVDIGGVLLEPPNKRTPNPSPRRLRPVLYSEAKTTRELARELVLGLGRLLAGSVRVVRAKGQPLTILLEGTRVAAVLLGSKRREKAFVKELDADVQRARRRVRALHSQQEVPPMQPHTPEQTRESVEPADDTGELHPTARKGRAMREQLEREHDLPANAIIAINVETGEWNLSEDPTDLGPSLKLREKDPKAPIYIGRVGGGPVFRLPSRR